MGGIHQLLMGVAGDTEVVGVGFWTITTYDSNYGYDSNFNGTISDGRFGPLGGAQIKQLYVGGTGVYSVVFSLFGSFANAGFTVMDITNSSGYETILYRQNASYSSDSGVTTWTWSGQSIDAFGLTGNAVVVFS